MRRPRIALWIDDNDIDGAWWIEWLPTRVVLWANDRVDAWSRYRIANPRYGDRFATRLFK